MKRGLPKPFSLKLGGGVSGPLLLLHLHCQSSEKMRTYAPSEVGPTSCVASVSEALSQD